MVKRSRGTRSCTRQLMRKGPRERGMKPITHALEEYNAGDRVDIIIDPAVHKGQPHRRFHGLTGVVKGARGRAYIVEVRVGSALKQIIARPEHLRRSRSIGGGE